MAPVDSTESRKRKRKSSEKPSKDHKPKKVKSKDQKPAVSRTVGKDERKEKRIRKPDRVRPGAKVASRSTLAKTAVQASDKARQSEETLLKERAQKAELITKGYLPLKEQKQQKQLLDKKARAKGESDPVQEPKAKKKTARRPQLAAKSKQEDSQEGQSVATAPAVSTEQKQSIWQLSSPSGGRFVDANPIFSPDGKHLLLATQTSFNVYSLETSLLVRAISVPPNARITAYALSRVDPNHVYVGTSDKSIVEFDWTKGERLGSRKTNQDVTEMQVVQVGDNGDSLYFIGSDFSAKNNVRTFYVWRMLRKSPSWEVATDVQRIWKSAEPLHHLRISNSGNHIFFASHDMLRVGHAEKNSSEYTWQELRCSDPITSLDIQESMQTVGGKKTDRSSKDQGLVLNLAIGGIRGACYVYTDVISKVFGKEASGKKDFSSLLKPRVLHWHREAVEAIQWSHDGNYILSGGHEFVLVLWQLETGKRQELPHLPSTITAIAVSSNGTSYGIQLADNSVIVLSTSELEATAHVTGIQSRSLGRTVVAAPKLQTVTSLAEEEDGAFNQWKENPAIINPRNSNQLLVAVPSMQTRTGTTSIPSAPYIQTFDILAGRHISRQPLTRNNATVKTIGPEATKLSEPNVKFMQTSQDGQWLATVDEWLPPKSDTNHFAERDEAVWKSCKARLESYLKFWRWNEEQNHWMLEARIDMPHRSNTSPANAATLDLVADPTGVGFATIGEDCFVRIWRPKTRLRNGSLRRGVHNGGAINWSCQHAIKLERVVPSDLFDEKYHSDAPPVNAKLAYSYDGSILAATHESSLRGTSNLVHLIDSAAGTIRTSLPSLYRSGLAGLGFCDRYLIVLSKDLIVWDLPANHLAYGFPLSLPSIKGQSARRLITNLSHLAVNSTSATFAIAMPAKDDGGVKKDLSDLAAMKSHVLVFDPTSPMPLFSRELPALVLSVMPMPTTTGFMVLDSVAELRNLSPPTGGAGALKINGFIQATNVPFSNSMRVGKTQAQQADAAPMTTLTADTAARAEDDEEAMSEDDVPVVQREQLANALDLGPAFALPPPRDIFDIVAGLYGK